MPRQAPPVRPRGSTGVQVVAPRWREDLALDAAEAIEAAWPMPTPIDPRGRTGGA
jgi:Asp-tRNA(Asn)/Glu-tRNA(Gln) amidotransferase A subunit family amidase